MMLLLLMIVVILILIVVDVVLVVVVGLRSSALDTKSLFKFRPLRLYLPIEVSMDSLLSPHLVVEL